MSRAGIGAFRLSARSSDRQEFFPATWLHALPSWEFQGALEDLRAPRARTAAPQLRFVFTFARWREACGSGDGVSRRKRTFATLLVKVVLSEPKL